MTFADLLNKWNVTPDTDKDGTTLEAVPDNLDDLCDAEGVVNDPEFSVFLDRLDAAKAYTDDHPVDRRAGLVSYAESEDEAAWYDGTGDFEWVETCC